MTRRIVLFAIAMAFVTLGCDKGFEEVPVNNKGEIPKPNRGTTNPHAGLNLRPGGGRQASSQDAGQGKEVILGGLKSSIPDAWIREAPANSMRFVQLKLPKADGDSTDASLIVYNQFGGTADENMNRWIGEFAPPPGKKIKDVAVVSDIEIGEHKAKRLDVTGTFKGGAGGGKGGPDYQAVGIHWNGPDRLVYHIKLTGPRKTVQNHLDGFNNWIKNFK